MIKPIESISAAFQIFQWTQTLSSYWKSSSSREQTWPRNLLKRMREVEELVQKTTQFLDKADVTDLGLEKLAHEWDQVQTIAVTDMKMILENRRVRDEKCKAGQTRPRQSCDATSV